MAIHLFYKGAALLGGIGSVAGGYFLVNGLSSSKENKVTSIEDRLRIEGYSLLNFSDTKSSGWDKIKEAYKLENTESKRFANVEKDGDNTLTGIVVACKKYIKGKSTDESNYKMARRWCIVPMSVKDKLGSGSLLRSGADVSDDNTEWDKVVSKNDKDNNKFITFEGDSKNNDDKRAEIKKKCSSKADIDTTKEEFDDSLKQVDSWCTKKASTI